MELLGHPNVRVQAQMMAYKGIETYLLSGHVMVDNILDPMILAKVCGVQGTLGFAFQVGSDTIPTKEELAEWLQENQEDIENALCSDIKRMSARAELWEAYKAQGDMEHIDDKVILALRTPGKQGKLASGSIDEEMNRLFPSSEGFEVEVESPYIAIGREGVWTNLAYKDLELKIIARSADHRRGDNDDYQVRKQTLLEDIEDKLLQARWSPVDPERVFFKKKASEEDDAPEFTNVVALEPDDFSWEGQYMCAQQAYAELFGSQVPVAVEFRMVRYLTEGQKRYSVRMSLNAGRLLTPRFNDYDVYIGAAYTFEAPFLSSTDRELMAEMFSAIPAPMWEESLLKILTLQSPEDKEEIKRIAIQNGVNYGSLDDRLVLALRSYKRKEAAGSRNVGQGDVTLELFGRTVGARMFAYFFPEEGKTNLYLDIEPRQFLFSGPGPLLPDITAEFQTREPLTDKNQCVAFLQGKIPEIEDQLAKGVDGWAVGYKNTVWRDLVSDGVVHDLDERLLLALRHGSKQASDDEYLPGEGIDWSWWGKYMRLRGYNTQEEARQDFFTILQHQDRSPSNAALFGQWGEEKCRRVADQAPIYWKGPLCFIGIPELIMRNTAVTIGLWDRATAMMGKVTVNPHKPGFYFIEGTFQTHDIFPVPAPRGVQTIKIKAEVQSDYVPRGLVDVVVGRADNWKLIESAIEVEVRSWPKTIKDKVRNELKARDVWEQVPETLLPLLYTTKTSKLAANRQYPLTLFGTKVTVSYDPETSLGEVSTNLLFKCQSNAGPIRFTAPSVGSVPLTLSHWRKNIEGHLVRAIQSLPEETKDKLKEAIKAQIDGGGEECSDDLVAALYSKPKPMQVEACFAVRADLGDHSKEEIAVEKVLGEHADDLQDAMEQFLSWVKANPEDAGDEGYALDDYKECMHALDPSTFSPPDQDWTLMFWNAPSIPHPVGVQCFGEEGWEQLIQDPCGFLTEESL